MGTIAERLLLVLKEYDINASTLAEKLNVTPSKVSGWINGKNDPNTESLVQIADVFNKLNLNWLLTGKEEMHKTKKYEGNDLVNVVSESEPANSDPELDINSYKLADLRRMQDIVDDMKAVNRELIYQARALVETSKALADANKKNADAILIHAESNKVLTNTNQEQATTIRLHAELDIEKEKTNFLKEKHLQEITLLITTMSRGAVSGKVQDKVAPK